MVAVSAWWSSLASFRGLVSPQLSARPEQALLALRKALGLFANLRPVWVHRSLAGSTPLRPELVEGVDLVVGTPGRLLLYRS